MERGLRSVILGLGFVTASIVGPVGPSIAAAAHQLAVTPNPVTAGTPVTVSDGNGVDDTCDGPAVSVTVSDSRGEVVLSGDAAPEADGHWSTVIETTTLVPSSYVLSASCESDPLTQCSDGTTTAGACRTCDDGRTTAGSCDTCWDGTTAVPGNCPAAQTCSDGTTTTGVCIPCDDGGTTAIACDVCSDSSTAVPGNCPASGAVRSATVTAPADVMPSISPPEAAGPFTYAPVTLVVSGATAPVTMTPAFTG